MARPDNFKRTKREDQPDELAELMTLWEGGLFQGFGL